MTEVYYKDLNSAEKQIAGYLKGNGVVRTSGISKQRTLIFFNRIKRLRDCKKVFIKWNDERKFALWGDTRNFDKFKRTMNNEYRAKTLHLDGWQQRGR